MEKEPFTSPDEDDVPKIPKKKAFKLTLKWFLPFIGLFIALVVLFMCFRIVCVDGNSMLDTYRDGDIVIVNSIGYALSDKSLDRGTVVVIKPTGSLKKAIIKRVIAVGGDEITIDFDNGIVAVNGEELNEEYIKEPTYLSGDFIYPIKVPEGHFFVMGDNRNDSLDSRSKYVGCVPKDDVLGAVMFAIPKLF